MVFGQCVIGPPGSGKTTYCDGMQQFLTAAGRKVAVINLDPANENLPYEAAADIRELVSLDGAASQHTLGPNGALVYCLEYLEANVDWLLERLTQLSDSYVLLDLPGQVELYTHHGSVRAVMQALGKHNHRLTAVHLVDAHHCSDAAKFFSVLLVTLSTMVQLEMPQVNLLSKIDLIEAYGELAFGLEFYTDVLDPSRLLPFLNGHSGAGGAEGSSSSDGSNGSRHDGSGGGGGGGGGTAASGDGGDGGGDCGGNGRRRQPAGLAAFARKHARLNAAIVELVDDFSLVSFGTLNIQDKESVARALRSIDKANGYCFGHVEGADVGIFTCAAGEAEWEDERVGSVTERYMNERELHDEFGGIGSRA